MNDTNGWRAVGAGAADWKILRARRSRATSSTSTRPSATAAAIQLLGGTTLPDINRIYRSTMLGRSIMGAARHLRHFNTSARLDHTLSQSGRRFAAASLSHSLIQDNVIYAYGPSIDPLTYAATCPTRRTHRHTSSAPTAPTASTTIAIPASCASTPKRKPWSRASEDRRSDACDHGRRRAVLPQRQDAGQRLPPVRLPLCKTARCTPMSARRISTNRSCHSLRRALSSRLDRGRSGKTVIRPPPFFRTACIFRAAFN